MSFQPGAFQFGAFQQIGSAPPVVGAGRRRNHYVIRGKEYLLSNDELYYVLSKLLEGDKALERRPKQKQAIRVRVPSEWVPMPTPVFDWSIRDDLVVEAKTKRYPVMLDFLQRYDDDEDVILLLYG